MEEENLDDDFGLITGRRRGRPRSTGLSLSFSCSPCKSLKSLSPHPNLALVKFWQGRVELLLRILCLVLSGSALTASVLAYNSVGFPPTGEDLVDATCSESRKVVVWVVCGASVAIFTEVLVVAGRFLNLQCALSHSSLIHVLDVIASVVFTAAYFTLSVPLIVFTGDVAHFIDILPELDAIVHYHTVQGRYSATVCLCLLSVVAFLVLSVWMSIYLSFNWDKKLERQLRLHPHHHRHDRRRRRQDAPTETSNEGANPSPDAPRNGQRSTSPQPHPPGTPTQEQNIDTEDSSSEESSQEDPEVQELRDQVLRDIFSL